MSTTTNTEGPLAQALMMIGEAQAVLRILDKRSIAVSDAQRTFITDCRDRDQLDRWVSRAGTATTVADLFD